MNPDTDPPETNDLADSEEPEEDEEPSSADDWKTPATIARIVGLFLFCMLFWIESPPRFLRYAGWPSWIFAVVLWLGELLAYAIGVAGIIVIAVFAGSFVVHWVRGARRWFRLQEIRSWRAKRRINNQQ